MNTTSPLTIENGLAPNPVELPENAWSRRKLLRAAGVAATTVWLPHHGQAAAARANVMQIPQWPGPFEVRQIWLRRRETGEAVIARYHDGRSIVTSEYLTICNLLRDVQANVVGNIDLDLLDLIFTMQRWLVSWGVDLPWTAHSGLRTPATNRKEKGADNSTHLVGKALDFSIAGIPADYMGKLAQVVSAGGVGFYSSAAFTHIDTGRPRTWRR